MLRSIKLRFALLSALCFALLAFVPPDCRPPRAWVDRHEPQAAYDRRIDDLYRVVAGLSRDERAGLLAIAYGESRFAKHVLHDCVATPPGAGNCSGGHARSYFQLERSACPELFERPKGDGAPETLQIAADCALKRWRYARGVCPELEGAFAKYGGRDCGHLTKSTAFKAYWYGRFFDAGER